MFSYSLSVRLLHQDKASSLFWKESVRPMKCVGFYIVSSHEQCQYLYCIVERPFIPKSSFIVLFIEKKYHVHNIHNVGALHAEM